MASLEIAIIDDMKAMHETLTDYLEMYGISVVENAYTLEQAEALADRIAATETQPHAIVIDGNLRSNLDGSDGEAIAKYMRSRPISSLLIGFSSGEEFGSVDYFVDKNGNAIAKLKEVLLSI